MRRNATLLMAIAALVLVLTPACALGNLLASESAPPVTPTLTPLPTFTPTPAELATPEVAPTNTPTEEPRATPTPPEPPATPTPEATPTPAEPTATPTPETATAVIDNPTLNVRSGPGTNYSIIGRASNGQSYEVTGKNASGSWYQINFNGQTGWVSGDFVIIQGNAGGIQVAANIPAPPPPPPTQPPAPATPTPPPAQPTQPTQPPAAQYPFQLLTGVERCDPNAGVTYFDGWVRRKDNSPRNGVCVHIAFYGPRNTKCSGCDGVGDGRWSFSPFGGPAPAGTTVEIFIVTCPPNMPPGGQSQQTGFGDLTPLSEKWVHTVNASEQCTGITFVGD